MAQRELHAAAKVFTFPRTTRLDALSFNFLQSFLLLKMSMAIILDVVPIGGDSRGERGGPWAELHHWLAWDNLISTHTVRVFSQA